MWSGQPPALALPAWHARQCDVSRDRNDPELSRPGDSGDAGNAGAIRWRQRRLCTGSFGNHLPLQLQRRAIRRRQALDPRAHAVPGLGHDDLMLVRRWPPGSSQSGQPGPDITTLLICLAAIPPGSFICTAA